MPVRLLDFKVEGLRDAQGRFAAALKETVAAKREEMRALGRRVVEVMREEAPVRTGYLRDHILFHTVREGRETELRVTSKAPYTIYVIRGRGPVVAGPGRVLRFEPGPPGSGFIFRKRVGPAKANPFQARAMRRLGREPELTVARIGRRITSAYAYGPGRRVY